LNLTVFPLRKKGCLFFAVALASNTAGIYEFRAASSAGAVPGATEPHVCVPVFAIGGGVSIAVGVSLSGVLGTTGPHLEKHMNRTTHEQRRKKSQRKAPCVLPSLEKAWQQQQLLGGIQKRKHIKEKP
jgi:hypothetical protein